jgi:hypothetical protein
VPARVLDRERERRVDLLRRLHVERGDLSAAKLAAAGVDVDRVARGDEITAVCQKLGG